MKIKRGKPTNWEKYFRYSERNFVVNLVQGQMFKSYERLLRRTEIDRPISVLELGAGSGYNSLKIAALYKTKDITIVDSNKRILAVSKRLFKSARFNVKFLCEDLFKLNLGKQFDIVHSAGLVEHFGGVMKSKVFGVHERFTKPGGHCLIFAPTPSTSYKIFRGLMELAGLWKFTDEVPMTKYQLVREIRRTGLKVVKTDDCWNYYLTENGILAKKSL